ncbi:hypothetical protein PEPS_14740 [Persicobacter psychrovividus]|uniref:Uncharacterized protein n=1 Tax=Persicobacter psychrovividus TaxID=387638 RepID=A0ABM7VE30_9BACT|nr:hypothetical protein PEPS_14740 [Persicobacter psychrovividus]
MKVIEVNNFKTRNRPVRIRMQGGVGGVLVKEEIFFHQPSTRFLLLFQLKKRLFNVCIVVLFFIYPLLPNIISLTLCD